jgi:predicted  nucleic acid-binding Zn-ribbon protein
MAGRLNRLMNPFDALLVPPALVKRALDDLHDIAQLARSYTEIEDEIRAMVAGIEEQIAGMRTGVDALLAEIVLLRAEMAPMSHLEPIRRGIEPLERSMVAVRESVDELEPMIADLDQKIRRIDPKLDEMQDSIEPIGDLAEKIPGNRRRR